MHSPDEVGPRHPAKTSQAKQKPNRRQPAVDATLHGDGDLNTAFNDHFKFSWLGRDARNVGRRKALFAAPEVRAGLFPLKRHVKETLDGHGEAIGLV
jgi:hypothetical protein